MLRSRSRSSLRGVGTDTSQGKTQVKNQSPICVYVDDDASVHLHIGSKGSINTKEASAHAVDEPLVSINGKQGKKKKQQSGTKKLAADDKNFTNNNNASKEFKSKVEGELEEKELKKEAGRPLSSSANLSRSGSKRDLSNTAKKEKDVDEYVNHHSKAPSYPRPYRHKGEESAEGEVYKGEPLSNHVYPEASVPPLTSVGVELETGDPMRRLGRMLLEAEIVSETAEQEIHKLFVLLPDLITEGHFVSAKDMNILRTLQDSCLNRLSDFQLISTDLRSVLRHTQDLLASVGRLQYASQDLSGRLTDYEAVNRRLQNTLLEKEEEIEELRRGMQQLKEETISSSTMQDSLQNTKAHLQKQLRQKEADCNRMAVQIRTLESQLARNKLDCEYMASLLREGRTGIEDDREELKKAARALKERLRKTEANLAEVQQELQQKSEQLKTSKGDSVPSKPTKTETQEEMSRYQELMKERNNLLNENQELQARLVNAEERMALQRERTALHQSQMSLHEAEKDDEITQLKESSKKSSPKENERLRRAVNLSDVRLNQAEVEMEGMREGLLHYESLTQQLSIQNDSKHCANITDMAGRLQETQQELSKVLSRLQESERSLRKMEAAKNELTEKGNKRDDQVLSLQRALEEKSRENAALMHQLEASLLDSRRQNENGREKQVVRERQLHSRIHELEAEMVQIRAENTRLRHEREDVERRTHSQLQDIRSQLEKSDVSNRSMQNYIQFLKKSYANSFGDA